MEDFKNFEVETKDIEGRKTISGRVKSFVAVGIIFFFVGIGYAYVSLNDSKTDAGTSSSTEVTDGVKKDCECGKHK